MSITFRPNLPLPKMIGYVWHCDEGFHGEPCPANETTLTVAEAEEWALERASCSLCGCQAFVLADYEEDHTPSVNLSNNNAFQALERLGIEADYCGEFDPVDFMGRAMVANVGREDDGVATVVDAEEGRATMVHCGLPAGYWSERMGALADVTTYARDKGVTVIWA